MREDKASPTGSFAVDGVHNGSITVRGWSRNEVRVRWRVSADSYNEKDAKDLFKQIHTRVSGGRASVDGPDRTFSNWIDGTNWEASVEIFAPYKTSLRLDAHNGAITVSDIAAQVDARSHNGAVRVERIQGGVDASSHNGLIRMTSVTGSAVFEAHNGQVTLTGLQGDVRGTSHNGGVTVELAGKSSASRSVDLESYNGGVNLGIPSGFALRVHTDTNHGGVSSDFPTTVRSSGGGMHRIDDGLRDFEIGSGGIPVRIRTNNGGIRLKRL
jgi:DUF4097 and DUF4098 domain-containing protein YvlB